ncbi:hypothetical protein SAMN05428963_103345 [Consotaella salsifontis]|uniref:Uncharacterized protein n=1 Tax=Consotaella salsifontis TaxID=1365950 RepID=A0A1T4P578_9HYPH|nr:hypothetical protein SAMN05428963_103345 [Consotaella salsifontis]
MLVGRLYDRVGQIFVQGRPFLNCAQVPARACNASLFRRSSRSLIPKLSQQPFCHGCWARWARFSRPIDAFIPRRIRDALRDPVGRTWAGTAHRMNSSVGDVDSVDQVQRSTEAQGPLFATPAERDRTKWDEAMILLEEAGRCKAGGADCRSMPLPSRGATGQTPVFPARGPSLLALSMSIGKRKRYTKHRDRLTEKKNLSMVALSIGPIKRLGVLLLGRGRRCPHLSDGNASSARSKDRYVA